MGFMSEIKACANVQAWPSMHSRIRAQNVGPVLSCVDCYEASLSHLWQLFRWVDDLVQMREEAWMKPFTERKFHKKRSK